MITWERKRSNNQQPKTEQPRSWSKTKMPKLTKVMPKVTKQTHGDGSKPWYLVNIKIAGKWMFIPLKVVLIGIDPYPHQLFDPFGSSHFFYQPFCQEVLPCSEDLLGIFQEWSYAMSPLGIPMAWDGWTIAHIHHVLTMAHFGFIWEKPSIVIWNIWYGICIYNIYYIILYYIILYYIIYIHTY